MKIIYETHPVSDERKKELREQGFKIIDKQFEPSDVEPKPVKAKPTKLSEAK